MSFELYMKRISSRANSEIFTINRHEKLNLRSTELRLLYNSYVTWLLRFGAYVWEGAETALLEAVGRIQRKAERLEIIQDYVPITENIAEEDTRLCR